jgi:hypothetical protein
MPPIGCHYVRRKKTGKKSLNSQKILGITHFSHRIKQCYLKGRKDLGMKGLLLLEYFGKIDKNLTLC